MHEVLVATRVPKTVSEPHRAANGDDEPFVTERDEKLAHNDLRLSGETAEHEGGQRQREANVNLANHREDRHEDHDDASHERA